MVIAAEQHFQLRRRHLDKCVLFIVHDESYVHLFIPVNQIKRATKTEWQKNRWYRQVEAVVGEQRHQNLIP
ncbi:hypothetical protein D3C75_1045690 [compost metagenome]